LLGGRKQDIVDFARLAAGAHRRRSAHASTRSQPAVARRPPRRRHDREDVDRPLRRALGRGRASVGVARDARLVAHGRRLSAIQGRDYARIYVKELDQGRAPVALSPEEREAVERAMAR
jgi:hypothetical protein